MVQASVIFNHKDSQSVVFNSGQKMALRALYVVIFPQALDEVKRAQHHLLAYIVGLIGSYKMALAVTIFWFT